MSAPIISSMERNPNRGPRKFQYHPLFDFSGIVNPKTCAKYAPVRDDDVQIQKECKKKKANEEKKANERCCNRCCYGSSGGGYWYLCTVNDCNCCDYICCCCKDNSECNCECPSC